MLRHHQILVLSAYSSGIFLSKVGTIFPKGYRSILFIEALVILHLPLISYLGAEINESDIAVNIDEYSMDDKALRDCCLKFTYCAGL
jgi:hypothetical protein